MSSRFQVLRIPIARCCRAGYGEILKLAAIRMPILRIRFSGDDNHLFFKIGERLLLSRKLTGNFSGLRTCAAERSAALDFTGPGRAAGGQSSEWRSSRMNGHVRFVSGLPMAN